MTDETHASEPHEQAEETVEQTTEEAPAASSNFTSGEGLVAVAGIVLLVSWIIFEVIAREYFVTWVVLLLAAGAAILPRLNREAVEKVNTLPVLMKAIGYAIAVMGVFTIVDDLRFEAYEDLTSILGALATYAGFVMAYMGARSIKT
ncbi:MAG: hypothetical protein U9N56_00650 [Actinomycetota bacterium]|nr:hypothetical protein [Actinomycetota bacterium]